MVSDNQQSEGFELTPLTINGMQDDPPLTEEVSIVGNDLQYESLVAEQGHQRQQLLHTRWWYSACHIPTSKRFCTILLLVLTISTSAVVWVGHYTNNRGEQISTKYNGRTEPPEKIGHFNIYIRESTYGDARRPSKRLRYPAAVYNQNELPLDSPFINFQLTIPIFTHPATQQTIILASNGYIYLLPKFYNAFGQAFSLGQLFASGYASFLSNSFEMSTVVDVAAMFHSRLLTGPNIPRFNYRTGGFTGGLHTNYRSLFVSNLQNTPTYVKKPSFQEQNTYDNELSSYDVRNPYYKKQPSYKEKTTAKPKSQPIITKCQRPTATNIVDKIKRSLVEAERPKLKMQPAADGTGNRVLLKNAYLVEFAPNANVTDHFRTITNSLKASHGIPEMAVKQRHIIQSSLFSGISFSLTVNHSTEALEMINEAIAIYPVYIVSAPEPIKTEVSPNIFYNESLDYINSHTLTGITQVHSKLHNFGKGVRVRKAHIYSPHRFL